MAFHKPRLGKRQVLNMKKTKELTQKLNNYFERNGNKQTIETLINEEAMLLGKH
jgi:hypothetical protein